MNEQMQELADLPADRDRKRLGVLHTAPYHAPGYHAAMVCLRTLLRLALPSALLTFAVLAVGCTDGGANPPSTAGAGGASHDGEGLPCEVSELLAARCQSCHSSPTKFGAPMPLVTRADLIAPLFGGQGTVGELSLERMKADKPMPPPPNERATDAEIAAFEAWVDVGMLAASAAEECGGGGSGSGGAGPGCTPDLAVTPLAAFSMPEDEIDAHICFGIDVPASDVARHITAIVPRIDNEAILHHLLFMQAPKSVSPDPAPCDVTASDWKLLYAWGPGTPAYVLPEEAGFPLAAGETGHFVLQVHYNNLKGLAGQVDQTGMDLCTTTALRPHDADIMAFGGMQFTLPPNAASELTCETTVPVIPGLPLTVFQAWPHMHTKGASLTTAIDHGGSTEVLADVPNYDFDYQVTYPATGKLNAGDVVRTRCGWQNDTGKSVPFGENTANEMCFNFVTYYPRVELAQWHWLLPAATAECQLVTK